MSEFRALLKRLGQEQAAIDRLEEIYGVDALKIGAEKAPEHDAELILPGEAGVLAYAQDIREKLSQTTQSFVVVAPGATGSGKSTFAEALQLELGPELSVVVGCDHFYIGDRLMTQRKVEHWDLPTAVALDEVNACIQDLKEGREFWRPVYSKDEGERHPTEKVLLEPRKVIILEGNFVLNEEITEFNDAVFIHVPFITAIERRIRRDVLIKRLTGRTVEKELNFLINTVWPAHQIHVAPQINRATHLLDNSEHRAIAA